MTKKAFHEGQILDIYLKPDTKEGYLGKGKLLEYVKTSLPFILHTSEISERLNLHYVIEFWVVDIKGVISRKGIRRTYSIGLTASDQPELQELEYGWKFPLIDIRENFVILPNYDTSFWEKRVDGTELPRGSMY